jgi:hypothetical protein
VQIEIGAVPDLGDSVMQDSPDHCIDRKCVGTVAILRWAAQQMNISSAEEAKTNTRIRLGYWGPAPSELNTIRHHAFV